MVIIACNIDPFKFKVEKNNYSKLKFCI
jgi:hypothetical protein